ncbi:MAG: hypothetical protein ACI4MS_03870 [Candidatus Coproplasma sp.]
MIYTIQNNLIKLSINSEGGAMTSLIYLPTNEERLWQGDERWWKGQDVVIFPIVGHAGAFMAKGQECQLKSHGLIRYRTLSVKDSGKDFITLCARSDEQSYEEFPYEWEFEITYSLDGNTLNVSYFVRSLNGVMPFYLGGHPGMKAPNGRAKITFENEELPVQYPLSGGAVSLGKTKGFTIDKQFLSEHKTYQLGSLSGGAIFAECEDGFVYTYRSDCPLYAFWSNENGGDYVCVEPWWGINDFEGSPKEITLKPFMNFERGKGSKFGYSLTIDKK